MGFLGIGEKVGEITEKVKEKVERRAKVNERK